MACDMTELCKFPSFYSCQKRFLLTHKEVDLLLMTMLRRIYGRGAAAADNSDDCDGDDDDGDDEQQQWQCLW